MDWLGDHMAAVWLAVAILFGIAELASLDLILLMLALGALVGMITALLGAGFAHAPHHAPSDRLRVTDEGSWGTIWR